MTRWGLAAALVVLALLTWGRIALVDGLDDQGYFAKYPAFADRILAGDIPRDRLGDLSPLYLWLVVLQRSIGMSLHAIRTAQIVALSLGALLCAMAAKRLGGWIAAIATALLILGNRAALVNASELEPETLIFVLIAGAIVAIISSAHRPPPAALPAATAKGRRPTANAAITAVAGLLVGLAVIARPVALVALILIAIWLAMRERRAALRFMGAALVPIAIVLAVNLSLIGSAIIMQPGTVFYEGNNPLSTGCAGVMPAIVAELNANSPEPDYLHVAYRLIAARATGRPMSPALANQYWSAKALAWMRSAPGAALELFAWKALLSIHNYDIYDLATSKRKSLELGAYPAIPFGLIVVLAVAALVMTKNRRALVPLVLFAAATFVALVVFTVTSRQRNALLPPLAVMGGVAVAEILALVRSKNDLTRAKNERALLAFGGVAIATMVLGVEGSPQREDRYTWESVLQSDMIRRAAVEARDHGDRVHAAELAAAASILDIDKPPMVSARTLRAVAISAAPQVTIPARRFDLAIALMKAGAYREADEILTTLRGYRPRREHRAVSSVAYYRAHCAIALHAPVDVASAMAEAPGDPNVLALAATRGDIGARRMLDELHDPFTRDRALAGAASFDSRFK